MFQNKLLLIPIMFLLSISFVFAVTQDYDIDGNGATSNDDYYINLPSSPLDYVYNSTTLYQMINTFVFPIDYQNTFQNINTSGIPVDATISSATLYYYIDSYTATRGLVKNFLVFERTSNEAGTLLIANTTFVSAGWYSEVLTPTEIAQIDVGANQKTMFFYEFDAGLPASKIRTMQLKAYEYATIDSYDAYLHVTWTVPGSGVCTNSYVSGDFIVNEEVNCTNENVVVDGRTIINQSLLRLTNTNFTTNHSNQNILKGVAKIIGDSISKIF